MMILTKRFCDPPNLSPIGFCGAKVWCFVGVRGYLRGVRHVIGRPFAAVGADLSCPHIRKHTRNGGGNADLVM